MAPLSILHVNGRSDAGGAAVAALSLHRALLGHGVASNLLAGRGAADPAAHVHSLGMERWRFLANVLAFRAGIGEAPLNGGLWRARWPLVEQADLLHLHNAHGYYLPTPVLADLLARPAVWTLHDHWLATGRRASPAGEGPPDRLERFLPFRGGGYPQQWIDGARRHQARLAALLERSAVRLVCVSAAQRERMGRLGLPLERMTVIPPAIFADATPPDAAQQARDRVACGLPGDQCLGLFAAASLDDPGKGWTVVEDALPRLSEPRRWTIVALGERGRRPARQTLANGVTVILPGLIPRDAMIPWLRAADVFINASFQETFGLVNVEAVGEGTPVVCSTLPAFREVLEDRAAYFPTGDAPILAARLDQLASGGVARPDAASVAALRQRYSLDEVASRHIRLYAEVAG